MADTEGFGPPPAFDPWLNAFLPALRAAGRRVLELGCGAGLDTATLTGAGFAVTACDRSPAALREARGRAPAARYFRADLRAPLPSADRRFDGVLASLSLHYFPRAQTEATVGEVRRVLRQGGAFLLRVNATDDVHHGVGEGELIEPDVYRAAPDQRYGQSFKRFFDEAAVRELLAGGWQIEQLAHRTIQRYAMPKQVWECLATKR